VRWVGVDVFEFDDICGFDPDADTEGGRDSSVVGAGCQRASLHLFRRSVAATGVL